MMGGRDEMVDPRPDEAPIGVLMDLKTVVNEVGTWPVEDRFRLIEEIWDGIATAPEATALTQAQEQDLRRRLDAYLDDPKAGSPWEEVKARLRGLGR